MITEIQMNSVASFKGATSITTDKKINLIYGLNGTGKSTISNFLYSPLEQRFSHCKKMPEETAPILVYNQKFIQDHFFVADKLKGIFSLSKENKAAEEKIAKATKEKAELEKQAEGKRSTKGQISQLFSEQRQKALDQAWGIKVEYSGGDRVLEYCLDGLKGQKDKLFAHLCAIAKPGKEPTKTVPVIREEVESLAGETAAVQQELPLLSWTASSVENDALFGSAIIGNADSEVSTLIESLGNADWVRQGLKYLPEVLGESELPCPFCQESTITSKFSSAVKSYFDTTYQQQVGSLVALRETYAAALEAAVDITAYAEHPYSQDFQQSLISKHQQFLALARDNLAAIDRKLAAPKLVVTLSDSSSALIEFNELVKSINSVVRDFNKRLANRASELDSLKSEFWDSMRWQYDQTVTRFESDQQSTNAMLAELDSEIKNIESGVAEAGKEITAAQKETVNVERAVEAINAGLVDLGIDDFKVEKYSDNLYRVVRSGEVEHAFHTLSEGEKMMISFLYFCELCKGKASAEDTHVHRIAVIDDPISSLSHIFVFNVGQLIRSVFFKEARFSQVFVLTHSLYFFYELTDPNHERRKATQRLFRITKSAAGSMIQEMKYEEIQNDYQAYWSVINEPTQPPALIANCMRNIIEYFFNFVRKKDLNNVFLMPELQEAKFQAFCRYINRESHSLGQNIIDMKEFNYETFREGLKLVFDKTGYVDHFHAMAKV